MLRRTVYVTQPFDTIKTRAQDVQGVGIGEAVRSVVRDYGVRGFWKGSSMLLGRPLLSDGDFFFFLYMRELLPFFLSRHIHRYGGCSEMMYICIFISYI